MTGAEATDLERSVASRAGSRWLVLNTVHERETGDVLFVQAVLAADNPLFQFFDPTEYPRLPASVVEAANKRHRKAHRVYERTMVSYSFGYWNSLFTQESWANKRIAVHREMPWERGGVLVAGAGGFIVDELPTPSGDAQIDWLGEMVVDLVRLRKAKDYQSADALRREIVIGAGAHVFMAKDGVEFINAEDWSSKSG